MIGNDRESWLETAVKMITAPVSLASLRGAGLSYARDAANLPRFAASSLLVAGRRGLRPS